MARSSDAIDRIMFKKCCAELASELDNIYKTESSHLEVTNFIDPRVVSTNITAAEVSISLDFQNGQCTVTPTPATGTRASDGSALSKLQKMIARVHNVNDTAGVCAEPLKAEMMRFRTQQNIGLEADPLHWWAGHRSLYPRLAITA